MSEEFGPAAVDFDIVRIHRRRQVRLVGGVALVLVVVGLTANAIVTRSAGPDPLTDLADPTSVELPKRPAGTSELRTFFEGDGAPLVGLLRLDPLTRGEQRGEPTTCRRLVPRLASLGEPPALRALAESAPDGATADMAATYVDQTVVFLAACASGRPTEQTELAFAATVLTRRLQQVGVSV